MRRNVAFNGQALAGMLWSKQYYYFDLNKWLTEHGRSSHGRLWSRVYSRNADWFHMLESAMISMPDKGSTRGACSVGSGFHTIALSFPVDFDFAKDQLFLLMLRNLYVHPNGQIPAYEWNFGDVNLPVHAWATLFLYRIETQLGRADVRFLERSFHGLMLNFNWWLT